MLVGQHRSNVLAQVVAGTGGTRQTLKPPGVTATHCPLGHSASLVQSPELFGRPASPATPELVDEELLDALLVAEAPPVEPDEAVEEVAPPLTDRPPPLPPAGVHEPVVPT